jgi:hypothetical protein
MKIHEGTIFHKGYDKWGNHYDELFWVTKNNKYAREYSTQVHSYYAVRDLNFVVLTKYTLSRVLKKIPVNHPLHKMMVGLFGYNLSYAQQYNILRSNNLVRPTINNMLSKRPNESLHGGRWSNFQLNRIMFGGLRKHYSKTYDGIYVPATKTIHHSGLFPEEYIFFNQKRDLRVIK